MHDSEHGRVARLPGSHGRRRLLAWAVAAAIGLGACSSSPPQPSASGLETVDGVAKATSSDNGKVVGLLPGYTLQVTLPADPSTGYSWQVSHIVPQYLQLVAGPSYSPSSPTPGSPASEVLVFRAMATGNSRLQLQYAGSGGTPSKTWSMSVRVLSLQLKPGSFAPHSVPSLPPASTVPKTTKK